MGAGGLGWLEKHGAVVNPADLDGKVWIWLRCSAGGCRVGQLLAGDLFDKCFETTKRLSEEES